MEEMNVTALGHRSNISWNSQLADELDAMDGKKDGKIKANVWNNFIKKSDSKGKSVSYFINTDEASKSLNYYAAKKDSGKVDWKNWRALLENFKKDIPVHIDNSDITAPQTAQVPENVTTEAMYLFAKTEIPKYGENKENAGKILQLSDGRFYLYDSDGRVEKVYADKNSLCNHNPEEELFYDEQGNVSSMLKYEYKDDEPVIMIDYDADGKLSAIYRHDYDEKGNQTGLIEYNNKGEVDNFGIYEYDKDNNVVTLSYDGTGKLTDVSKQTSNDINIFYSTEGKYKNAEKTEYKEDKDGNIVSQKTYWWNSKGNLIKR